MNVMFSAYNYQIANAFGIYTSTNQIDICGAIVQKAHKIQTPQHKYLIIINYYYYLNNWK